MRDYQDLTSSTTQQPLSPEVLETTTTNGIHTVAIALGSNLGDRFRNIELALRLLEIPQQLLSSNGQETDERGEMRGEEDSPLDLTAMVSVVDTSFLYETAPMYVTDQPSFINCACLVNAFPPSPAKNMRLMIFIQGRNESPTNDSASSLKEDRIDRWACPIHPIWTKGRGPRSGVVRPTSA